MYTTLEKKFLALVKIAVDKFALKDLMKNDAKCPRSLDTKVCFNYIDTY